MEIKETVQVSENTVNSVSAPRNLLDCDSAYDRFQTSFSQTHRLIVEINRRKQFQNVVINPIMRVNG